MLKSEGISSVRQPPLSWMALKCSSASEGIPLGSPCSSKGCRDTPSQINSPALEAQGFGVDVIRWESKHFLKHLRMAMLNLEIHLFYFFHSLELKKKEQKNSYSMNGFVLRELFLVDKDVEMGARMLSGGKDPYQRRENYALFELLMKTILSQY